MRAAQQIDADIVSVLMTGHGSINTAVAAMKSGALDYILKPFNLSIIVPAVTRASAVRRPRLQNAALLKRVAERTPEASPLDLERLQQHAQQVMTVIRALTAKSALADDALLAALLHDIGYWVLAHECPHDLKRAHAWARDKGITLDDAEREVIGASHAQVGAYLLGIWGLPYTVVEAVAHHHAPEGVRQKELDVLATLAVAHTLTDADDTSAFDGSLVRDHAVGAEYLAALGAPFSWEEASQRARECLSSKEATS
jgi:putative nucleotidyltransferase with HDIG domain